VLTIFLWMFVAAGVSLLALLFLGAVDEDGLAPEHVSGLAGLAAAFLSIRGLLAAMTVAGGAGALLLGVMRTPSAVAIGGAMVGAVIGARAWRSMLRKLRYFDRDHGASPELLVGREGVLTVAIDGQRLPGVMQVTLGGLSQEYTAIPDGDGIFHEGDRVVVLRFESPSTVVVGPSPYPALPLIQ